MLCKRIYYLFFNEQNKYNYLCNLMCCDAVCSRDKKVRQRLRGIHQFSVSHSELINILKRLYSAVCVYFYYGANKSGSRAMWVLRQSDAISVFLLQAMCSISGLFMTEENSLCAVPHGW